MKHIEAMCQAMQSKAEPCKALHSKTNLRNTQQSHVKISVGANVLSHDSPEEPAWEVSLKKRDGVSPTQAADPLDAKGGILLKPFLLKQQLAILSTEKFLWQHMSAGTSFC